MPDDKKGVHNRKNGELNRKEDHGVLLKMEEAYIQTIFGNHKKMGYNILLSIIWGKEELVQLKD